MSSDSVKVNQIDVATAHKVLPITDASVRKRAKELWDEAMSDMTPEWRDMAWDDMGGSEPSQERVEYEMQAHCELAALMTGSADLR